MFDETHAPYENASVTLLAAQPPTLPEKLPKEDDGWVTIFAHLEARLASLRVWRYSFWSHWAVLAEYFLPRRYHWLVVPNWMNRGSPINERIVDSTGLQAVNTCASGMWSGLTSPSRQWFKYAIGLPWVELEADAKEWLEDTEKRIYTVLSDSNFYSIMAQAFQDLVVFGSAPVLIYEDHEDVVRFYLPCAGEYFLGNGSRFSVDTVYREFTMTVLQIVDMFTLERCPENVRKLWQSGGTSLQDEFVVCCAIEPNFDLSKKGDADGKVAVVSGKFGWREVYWLRGNKTAQCLSKKGFNYRPFMALRWSTVSNDPYGRSPCMDALGDNKQVQMETREKAEFIKKLTKPAMGGDPSMKNEPMTQVPGGVTFTSTEGGKKGFWPLYEVSPQALAPMVLDIKEVNERIKNCLFVNVFMAISQMQGVQPRNELELTKRDLERLQTLGPIISASEDELSIMIQRVHEILDRKRMLKPIPDSLKGIPLKIEYTSIMRLAQRSAESVAIKDLLVTAGELSAAAKAAEVPDPIRNINLDKAIRHYGELNNCPTDIFYTDDEVQKHDAARAQVKQQAQVPGAAMAGVTAAKTLAETPMGGNTALSALLGQQGAGGGGA